ncbi:hypothetical protein BKA70DRAFT_1418873 [Coprinopsis sp. MPI-PUGE-AT-0042]|nr:hypothetical protein BKA70DRAFT_1418873 [Coprinopsis sp. MPI-PUGE-AT-0042]
MAMVVRDPRFSMSAFPASKHARYPSSVASQPRSHTSTRSVTKRLERRMINLWKAFTNTKGRQRASVYSAQFVTMTATRRKSGLPPQLVRL